MKSKEAAEYVDIDTLIPWDRNPRKHERADPEIAASIVRFGFGTPLLVRTADRRIIAGHTRRAAVLSLPERWRRSTPTEREAWSAEAATLATSMPQLVPVRWMDLDDAQASALALADNRLGEIAEWDQAALEAVLRDLEAQGVDPLACGFDEAELARSWTATSRSPRRGTPPSSTSASSSGCRGTVGSTARGTRSAGCPISPWSPASPVDATSPHPPWSRGRRRRRP